jgi:GTP-binding protein HflX
VSALTGEGVEGLLATIENALPHPPVEVTMLVPYGREDLIARLYRNAEVLSIRHDGEGTLVHARVGLRDLAAVREFVRTERRRGA